MCLTLPAQVRSVDGATATVEMGGRLHEVMTILQPDVVVGDWVTVSAGTILERLDPDEAAFIREEIARADATG